MVERVGFEPTNGRFTDSDPQNLYGTRWLSGSPAKKTYRQRKKVIMCAAYGPAASGGISESSSPLFLLGSDPGKLIKERLTAAN